MPSTQPSDYEISALKQPPQEVEKSVLAASVQSGVLQSRQGESPPVHKGSASKSPARGKGKARGADKSPARSQVAGGR